MKKLNKTEVKEYMSLHNKYCNFVIGLGKMTKSKVERFLKLEDAYFKLNIK